MRGNSSWYEGGRTIVVLSDMPLGRKMVCSTGGPGLVRGTSQWLHRFWYW